MKIVHICLCGPFSEGFGYQENILSKYHKKAGYEVSIITSRWSWSNRGTKEFVETERYTNDDGINVIRLPILIGTIDNRFKIYKHFYACIDEEKPDILFIHGCQFLNIITICKYLRKNKIEKVYVDNHVDYFNGAHGILSKLILHKGIWKYCVHRIEPYVNKFYGVLPARVDFLIDMYKLPKEKCELLLMGADDDYIDRAKNIKTMQINRHKYNISKQDFVIVTGGKYGQNRKEIIELVKAISKINDERIKLLFFGSFSEEILEELSPYLDDGIVNIGWLNNVDIYEIFAIADLVVFNGLHSVMWEQAVAMGVPCIFKRMKGFEHLDLGGNCIFMDDMSEEFLIKHISKLIHDEKVYRDMKNVALEQGIKHFSYKKIAIKSLEIM